MRNTADVTGGKLIAVLLQSISGVSAINPLVAFYDIHGGKREVLFFYFVPDTTRDEMVDMFLILLLEFPLLTSQRLTKYMSSTLSLYPQEALPCDIYDDL
jgi:hypothetical protein